MPLSTSRRTRIWSSRTRLPIIAHDTATLPLSVLGVREAVRQNGMALQYAAEALSLHD